MSFLQNTTLLPSTNHSIAKSPTKLTSNHASSADGGPTLRSRSSIAALVNLVRNPIAAVGEAVDSWYDGLTPEQRAHRQAIEDRKHILYLKLRSASNYDDWKASATELDELEDNNDWKKITDSPDYDSQLVEARLRQLEEARISCDVGRMLFLVRTSLTRELGNMGNLKLYKHSHVGTKDLIERYITSALETLDQLLNISERAKCDGLETKHILEQVLSARQAFGRSALLLSGGATFGMNHIGVLKALWERRLLPRIISGASAGSIVSAVMCTRTDEEMPALLESFCYGDLAVFEAEGDEDSILRKLARFLKFGALFDISHLTRVMKEMLGDMTFQEAYNRTRRILNICVSSASLYELPRLLNYITAPNVLIWSAVAASCSVPLIFSAASLLAKDPKTGEAVPWNPSPQQWIDGSVDNDLPMTRLAEMFNVNHFIVSQVNPHVVPFLIKEDDLITEDACQSTSALAAGPSWVHTMTHLAKGEALHRMHVMAEMGIFPNALTKAVSVLSQKYSGDITILPEISYTDFPRMLSNPTIGFMVKAMLSGERATWPKLSRVRNHCAIELALDEAVQKLRTRVVFSSSQADLRLGRPKSTRSEHVRVRRKLSNNSEIDASAIKDIRNGRVQTLKDTKHQKSQSLDIPLRLSNHHKKQKSETSTKAEMAKPWEPYETSAIASWADNQALSPIASSPVGPLTIGNSLPPSKITYDLLSGPEKTSADSTSDSDNSFSSESLSSPPIPDLWPQSRTQPTTPAIERERRSNWSFSTLPAEESEKPRGKSRTPDVSLTAGSGDLSMTPANESGPEKQYKRLFHSARNRLSGSEPQVIVSRDSESGTEKGSDAGKEEGPGRLKRWNAMGLAIDISGTRGMVLRKKRGDESR